MAVVPEVCGPEEQAKRLVIVRLHVERVGIHPLRLLDDPIHEDRPQVHPWATLMPVGIGEQRLIQELITGLRK